MNSVYQVNQNIHHDLFADCCVGVPDCYFNPVSLGLPTLCHRYLYFFCNLYIYIKRSICVKRTNDSIKVRLCSRCYRFHRLIECRNVVNNVLVQNQCSCLSTAPPKSWLKKAEKYRYGRWVGHSQGMTDKSESSLAKSF